MQQDNDGAVGTTTAGEESADADELDELRHALADTDSKWRQTAADLANLQKRFQRELDRGHAAERERMLMHWVGTIDDLDRALNHADIGRGDFVDGVRAIVKHATMTLASLGYPRFGEVGDVFDPTLHDVVSTVPATEQLPANVVVGVVKPGYGTADNLLRPASVVVAKEPD